MSDLSQVPEVAVKDATQSIYFSSFEQVQSYPGYRFDINPATSELVGMIGWYFLNPMVPCGLSSCHHEHKRGYVVVTAEGEVTNIGNVCGKTHFREGWTVHRNALESRRRVQIYRESIAACVANKQAFADRLRALKECDRGANWQNALVTEFTQVMPYEIMKQLRDRAARGLSEVSYERPMSIQEMEDEDVRLGRESEGDGYSRGVRYLRVPCGDLMGLRIWSRPIRKVLIDELEQGMRQLLAQDIYQLSEQRLLKLYRWVEQSDRIFKEADTLLLQGQAFFKKANLQLLMRFQIAGEGRAKVARNLPAFWSKHRLT